MAETIKREVRTDVAAGRLKQQQKKRRTIDRTNSKTESYCSRAHLDWDPCTPRQEH